MKNLFSLWAFVFALHAYGQSSLHGTWNNEEVGTLIFNANGSGTFAGGSFTYTSTAGKIFASSEEGDFTYNYKVVNGQLVLSGGIFPAPVTFTKGRTTGSGNYGNNSTSGTIDKSIAGTWCWTKTSGTYTNASSGSTRCIVLNANGTYQYTYEGAISGSGGDYYGGSASQSADHGTWKLNGNTISVVSASEGAVTYSFQKKNHPKTGDPMIVIDGDAYVTYYQRNPW